MVVMAMETRVEVLCVSWMEVYTYCHGSWSDVVEQGVAYVEPIGVTFE